MTEDYISVDIEGPQESPVLETSAIREIGACSVWNTEDRFFVDLTKVAPDLAIARFSIWLEKFRKPIMVCFNTWDWLHINYYFWKYLKGCQFGVPGRVIDIKIYYMGMMNKEYRETNKRDIVKLFPSIQKHTHNGLDDAVEQAQIFRGMLEFNDKFKP